MGEIKRVPFLCIDSRWLSRWKWLWGAYAAEAEEYAGYVDAWDGIPWKEVKFDDGVVRDHNYAAPAQYIPIYAGDTIGHVDDIIEMLDADGIAESELNAQYQHGATSQLHPLYDLFFRDYDHRNRACPIVYSRPQTFRYGGPGHIGDNSEQVFFISSHYSCDGTLGLRGTLEANFRREFWADAIWFFRSISGLDPFPPNSRLVLYIIAAGSVPRIKINDIWHIVSPDYFPSYGDPYGFVYRGHKAVIEDHGLISGAHKNEIIVEHIAPTADNIGAQVIFVLEWDVK